ncbi:hypothetical protein KUCAC02_027231, partial [Chaenocephalus aceratus]
RSHQAGNQNQTKHNGRPKAFSMEGRRSEAGGEKQSRAELWKNHRQVEWGRSVSYFTSDQDMPYCTEPLICADVSLIKLVNRQTLSSPVLSERVKDP